MTNFFVNSLLDSVNPNQVENLKLIYKSFRNIHEFEVLGMEEFQLNPLSMNFIVYILETMFLASFSNSEQVV